MADHIQLRLDASGNLENPGTTSRNDFLARKTVWEIADDRIQSFRIEAKDGNGSFYPFTDQPNINFSTKEDLKVIRFYGKKGEWSYKIIWNDSRGTHTLDPKIAVDPIGPFAPISILIAVMVFSILGVRYYRRNIKRK